MPAINSAPLEMTMAFCFDQVLFAGLQAAIDISALLSELQSDHCYLPDQQIHDQSTGQDIQRP
jgi:hypothetical protein